jgi:hypothetical protein
MQPAIHHKMSGRPLMAAALLAVSALFWVLERDGESWGFGWHYAIFVILIGWYLRMLLRDNTAATLTSFYQIWAGIGLLLSSAIIASGAEMIEIGATGTANGVFWMMLGFFVVGMEATVLGYRFGGGIHFPLRALRLPAGLDRTLMWALVLPALLLSLYVFVLTGGPILRGVDRVAFWRDVAPAGSRILPSLINQSFFFVAVVYLWQQRVAGSMSLPRLLLLSYLVIGLMVLGQKLSLFILFLNIWLVVLMGVRPGFRSRGRHILIFGIVLGLLLVVVGVSYISSDKELGFILVRGALQAQLLWSVAEASLDGGLPPPRPDCYFGCDWYASGADYISFMFLPMGLYDYYRDIGNAVSGFMPALPILTFGVPLTLLLHVLVGFVSGVLQRKITTALNVNQPIYGFLLFKLHFAVTLIWFAAQQAAILGMLTVLVLILLYRLAGQDSPANLPSPTAGV